MTIKNVLSITMELDKKNIDLKLKITYSCNIQIILIVFMNFKAKVIINSKYFHF